MNTREKMPRPEEDELDWLIRRTLQQAVANAEPPADLWWQIRRDLAGGTGPRRRTGAFRARERGSLWIAAALRVSSAFNRVWSSSLNHEQAMLLEQKWSTAFVLLGFAPLGRVY